MDQSTFDHTSVIRLIESVTGVMCPNISAWRRSTSGNLADVLGPASNATPHLPGTQAALVAAEQQVKNFAPPPIPGAAQSFPVQPPGRRPSLASASAPSGHASAGAA